MSTDDDSSSRNGTCGRHQEMQQQLSNVRDIVQDIHEVSVKIQAACPGCTDEIERLRTVVKELDGAIRGNGGDGLRVQVALLRTGLNTIRRGQNVQLGASISMLLTLVGIVLTHLMGQ